MMLVTFTQDMRPYTRGQDVPLPDELALQMMTEGVAENPRAFPPTEEPVSAKRRPKMYLTK